MERKDGLGKVYCVILNYNDSDRTIAAAKNLSGMATVERIAVVDNQSRPEEAAKLRGALGPRADLIENGRNSGYGAGNNAGIRHLMDRYGAKHILICNPDTYIDEKSVKETLRVFEKERGAAIIAPAAFNRKMNRSKAAWRMPTIADYSFSMLYFIGRRFPPRYCGFDAPDCERVDCVSGALLMIDAEKFREAGMYDEKLFLYCEETLIGIKLRDAGYATYVCNAAKYVHNHDYGGERFRKLLRQKRTLARSRCYVLKNYMGAKPGQMLAARAALGFAVFEKAIIYAVKGAARGLFGILRRGKGRA